MLDVYVTIKKDATQRDRLILNLSQFLRGQINNGKEIASEAYAGTADINYKLGKLEYIMTDGERGLPGAMISCMEQAVDLYRNDYDRYLLYKKAAKQYVSIDQIEYREENPKVIETSDNQNEEFLHEQENFPVKESIFPEAEKDRKELDDTLAYKDLFPLDTSILKLDVSNRLKHILYWNGIKTIENMLDFPDDKWMTLSGMGTKTFDELSVVLEKYRSVSRESLLLLKKDPKLISGAGIEADNLNHQKELVIDGEMIPRKYLIAILPISNRLKNALLHNGLLTVADLLECKEDDLAHMRGLGQKKLAELNEFLKKNVLGIPDLKKHEELQNFIPFAGVFPISYDYVKNVLSENGENRNAAGKICEDNRIREVVKAWILRCLKGKRYDGIHINEFVSKIPEQVYDDTAFVKLLEEMEESNDIRRKGDMIFAVYPSFDEYLNLESNEKTKRIMKLRLEGKTLEEIAKEAGITRERVRQIQQNFLKKMPIVDEEYWISVQKKYSELTEEDFAFVFQLSMRAIMLLRLFGCVFFNENRVVADEGRVQALYRIMNDSEADETIRHRAQKREKEINPRLIIDGISILKKRDALVRYVIKDFCHEQKPLAELKACYDTFRMGIGDEAAGESFAIDVRYLEHYSKAMITLSGGRKRLRYYDILANDYGELLDELDFQSYANVTMSSLKFFRDYPEIMKQYDIRSEYELHNLLKKLWEHGHYNDYLDEEHKLTFEKMPMITFGNADRAAQIMRLLRETAPISYMDFAKLIEAEYGIPQLIALSNWVGYVADYLINGTYVINESPMPIEHLERLKEILAEDFYATEEIENVYAAEYPEIDSRDIGITNMYRIGFVSHGKYAIRNTYKNTMDYFEQLFEKEEIIDVRDKPEFALASSYSGIRIRLQEEYKIVEVEPGLFYSIRHLNKMGLTRDDLLSFCKTVERFVNDDKCFTVKSLRGRGFVFPWSEYRLSDWFYSALLSSYKKAFESRRFGKSKLLRRRKGKDIVTLTDLLEEITEKVHYVLTTGEICQILRNEYGIEFNPWKIKELMQDNVFIQDKLIF